MFKVVILCLEFSDMAAESQSVFFGNFQIYNLVDDPQYEGCSP